MTTNKTWKPDALRMMCELVREPLYVAMGGKRYEIACALVRCGIAKMTRVTRSGYNVELA